jgi:glycosyltransferase involved in cell wall biosynthesis
LESAQKDENVLIMSAIDKAKSYLTDWLDVMAEENQLNNITWIAGGAKNNESMVVYHLKTIKDYLNRYNNKIYTNCVNIDGWENSYIVNPNKIWGVDNYHVFQVGIANALAMLVEEGFNSDLYITNGLPPAMTIYGNGLAYYNNPKPPVISVMAKVPEDNWDYVPENIAVELLKYLCDVSTYWMFLLDSKNELKLAKSLVDRAGHKYYDRIRKVSYHRWDYDKDKFPIEKEDVVVWSGRPSKMKYRKLAEEIYSLLPNIKKEMWIPQSVKVVNSNNLIYHVGEPPDIYRESTRKAKVLLITSKAEGYPIGYIELMCQGVIPVVYKRGWATDLFPEDYEYYFNTPGEGAELIIKAMKEYNTYISKFEEWCRYRFTKIPNVNKLIDEVWLDYTLKLGNNIRLLGKRGARKNL